MFDDHSYLYIYFPSKLSNSIARFHTFSWWSTKYVVCGLVKTMEKRFKIQQGVKKHILERQYYANDEQFKRFTLCEIGAILKS